MPIKIKGDKELYDVRDRHCIGRSCLKLHPIQIRGATPSGSRFIGYRHACARRDYDGCPQPIPQYDRTLTKQRQADGMKNV